MQVKWYTLFLLFFAIGAFAESGDFEQEKQEKKVDVFLLLVFLLMLVSFLVSYVVDKHHLHALPESAVFIVIGIIGGAILQAAGGKGSDDLMNFSPTVFFLIMLPPIIFDAGYHLQKLHFFANFGSILTFAMFGTVISSLVIACIIWVVGASGMSVEIPFAECLVFGSLISATDPVSTLAVFGELKVDPLVFSLVFGESALNDAVAIVLFQTFVKFVNKSAEETSVVEIVLNFFGIFLGSVAIGIAVGMLTSLLFKHVNIRRSTILELCVFSLFAYIPFLLAEAIELSGIVSILFTG